ncbi:sentrin-specific protease 8 [Chironomus tepperi]|uniref:sentrin-specific protease 8 n=1 Tax=Chironomus tepperi TaxID=113505 RepID=UPI00391F8658
MQQRRSRVKQMSNRTVLSFHGITLKESDIEILRSNSWLNDQIIAFYFQFLESHTYRHFADDFLFVSPQVTQLLKMIERRFEEAKCLLDPLHPHTKQFLFFPVNDNEHERAGGTHWNLLVYSRPENTFYSYDSHGNHNEFATGKIVDVLRVALKCRTAHFIYCPSAQQRNMYDCGIYVICNVENIIKHIISDGTLRHVRQLSYDCVVEKRSEILRMIESLGGKI